MRTGGSVVAGVTLLRVEVLEPEMKRTWELEVVRARVTAEVPEPSVRGVLGARVWPEGRMYWL